MCYSIDLREKAIEFIESKGSIQEGASVFGISTRTIYNWLKKKRETGSLEDKVPSRPWRKLDPDALVAFVKAYPDFMLNEYAQHFNSKASTICEAFKRLGITRKKRLYFTKSGTKKVVRHFWEN